MPTLVLLLSVLAALAAAETPQPAASQIIVSISARALQPGEVIRLDVRAPEDVRQVQVQAFGRVVPAAPVGPGAWRALVGVDLGVAPGEQAIVVYGATALGRTAEQHQTLVIEDKTFPTRTLTVDPRFVTPPPSARPRIERDARRLAAIFAGEDTAPVWPGAFGLPIEGTVVSGFGVRSVFNGEPRAPHGGADFASPTGTPVDAPADGLVVLAEDLYFTGGTVVVAHGGGLYSLFAHLSRTAVKEGERIWRGQLLGEVGATGRATGPHLHWTVRLHTARVDPLSLIVATGSSGPPSQPVPPGPR